LLKICVFLIVEIDLEFIQKSVSLQQIKKIQDCTTSQLNYYFVIV